MKRIRSLLRTFLIAAVFAAQPGCQYLLGKAAIEVGKEAYKKVKNDHDENKAEKERERNQQTERERREQRERDNQDQTNKEEPDREE